MKFKALIIVVFIQIIAIIILYLQIQYKSSSYPKISVSPINSKTVQKIPSNSLKYFWERNANTVEVVERDWLPSKVKYTINKDALNERFDYPVKKEKDVFRIITLGDSFTFGAYVNTNENWTELLEDRLNQNHTCNSIKKYEVINLAQDGYDLAYETEKYIRRGVKYNPDLVIMFVTDFKRVADLLAQSYIDIKLSNAEKEKLNKEGKYHIYNMYDSSYSIADRVKYQEKYLKKLLSIYKNTFLMVDHEKNPKFKVTLEDSSKKYKFILERTQQPIYGIEKYHVADGHPSPEGHVEIMKEVENFLTKDKLIPCQ